MTSGVERPPAIAWEALFLSEAHESALARIVVVCAYTHVENILSSLLGHLLVFRWGGYFTRCVARISSPFPVFSMKRIEVRAPWVRISPLCTQKHAKATHPRRDEDSVGFLYLILNISSRIGQRTATTVDISRRFA